MPPVLKPSWADEEARPAGTCENPFSHRPTGFDEKIAESLDFTNQTLPVFPEFLEFFVRGHQKGFFQSSSLVVVTSPRARFGHFREMPTSSAKMVTAVRS